jgi:hypothetical protein
VYAVAAVTAPNLWHHHRNKTKRGALTASEGRVRGGTRNGIMCSQCPEYAMHAKEIGLRIMRSYQRPHLEQQGGKGGLTHRAYGGRHHNKELNPERECFNLSRCAHTPPPSTGNTHRNQSPFSTILQKRRSRPFDKCRCRKRSGGQARLDRILDIMILQAPANSPQRQLEPTPGG